MVVIAYQAWSNVYLLQERAQELVGVLVICMLIEQFKIGLLVIFKVLFLCKVLILGGNWFHLAIN